MENSLGEPIRSFLFTFFDHDLFCMLDQIVYLVLPVCVSWTDSYCCCRVDAAICCQDRRVQQVSDLHLALGIRGQTRKSNTTANC